MCGLIFNNNLLRTRERGAAWIFLIKNGRRGIDKMKMERETTQKIRMRIKMGE